MILENTGFLDVIGWSDVIGSCHDKSPNDQRHWFSVFVDKLSQGGRGRRGGMSEIKSTTAKFGLLAGSVD